MHGVQIGNSLVGYGAGAGQERGRPSSGSPGTLEESHRQCTGRGRGGGGGGKRKHSTQAPGKRAVYCGAKPSLQVNVTSPRRPGEEANPVHSAKGLPCVWLHDSHLHVPCLTSYRNRKHCFALQMGKLRLRELICAGAFVSRTSPPPQKGRAKGILGS